MSRSKLAVFLKQEIKALEGLAGSLEDESEICFPEEYAYYNVLREIIADLRKIYRMSRIISL